MDRNFALATNQKKPILDRSQVTQLAQATRRMVSQLPSLGRESDIRDMSLHTIKEEQDEQRETEASARSVDQALEILTSLMY